MKGVQGVQDDSIFREKSSEPLYPDIRLELLELLELLTNTPWESLVRLRTSRTPPSATDASSNIPVPYLYPFSLPCIAAPMSLRPRP